MPGEKGKRRGKGSPGGPEEPYPQISVKFGSMHYVPADVSPQTKRPSSKDHLKALGESVKRVRSLFFDIAFLLFVGFLMTLAIYLAFSGQKLVIEPIEAPKNLLSLGYSEDVSAHRLMDAILEVERAAKTRRGNLDVIPQSREVDITIPEIGTLFDTVLHYAKQVLSRQDIAVAGEFICSTEACKRDDIYLRLRVLGGMQATINLDTIGVHSEISGEDWYFRAAAIEILEEVDPYFVAAYYYDRDPEKAENVIRRIIRNRGTASDLALAYNLLGGIRLHAGNHEAAKIWFEKAIEKDPELVEAYSNWGNALLVQNEVDQAISKYRQAIAIDPKFASAHANIGDAQMRRGNVDEAIEIYQSAIKLDPNLAYAYANLGDAWSRKGDKLAAQGLERERESAYRASFDYFRDAIDIQPNLVFAYVSWGNAHIKLGNYPAARGKFQQALERAMLDDIPNKSGVLAYVHASLGDLHARSRDDNQKAIEAFTTALEHKPENLQALVGLGDALYRERDYDGALEHYHRAVEKKGDYARALVAIGDANFRKGTEFLDDAAAAYMKALGVSQDTYRAHEGLGNVATRRKEYDAALVHFSNAIHANKNAVHSHAGLGSVHFRLKQYSQAKDAYLAALEVNPDVAYIHAGLGDTQKRIGHWTEAADSFAAAANRAPKNMRYYKEWENALRHDERISDVPDMLRAWIEVSPDSAEPYYRLGVVLEELDDPEAAREAYESAVEFSPDPANEYYDKSRGKLDALIRPLENEDIEEG